MSARDKAVRVKHIEDITLDLPGVFLRVERRWWADGTSCLHIAKWGTKNGRKAPWYPLQYIQMPWELAKEFGGRILFWAVAGDFTERLDKAQDELESEG